MPGPSSFPPACGGDRCFEPANWFFHGGDDDLVLGPELVIDGRLGHSDGVGDHLKRRTADAMLAEKPECGLDDSLLRRTQGCPGWVSSHGCSGHCAESIGRVALV